MIKAIIFDWGGVLEFYNLSKLNRIITRKYKVDVNHFSKVELKHRINHDWGRINSTQFVNLIAKDLGVEINKDEYFTINNNCSRLNLPLIDLIKKLKSQYKIFVLSNGSNPTRNKIIKSKVLKSLFNEILFSYQVGLKKPDKRFFQLLLRKHHLAFGECLFIDDRADLVKSAEKIGLNGIVYTSLPRLRMELIKFKIKY